MIPSDGWERIRRRLLYHARHATWGRYQDAEDCVSEAVYHYLLRVKSGKLIAYPMRYLVAAVNNNARTQRRRARFMAPHYAAEPPYDSTGAIDDRVDKEARLRPLRDHRDYAFLVSYYGEHRGSRSPRDRVKAVRARQRMRLA